MESVRVIIQAVNENNTALALRTVDAELQKNPTSDVYLSLKVFVAHKANDRSMAVKTAEQAVKYCSKKTSEMFLIPALAAYNESELLLAVFVRTNRLDPQDQDITEGWIEVMLLMGNLSSAQKALMAQQKHSKKPRLTCFEVCLVMALDKPNPIFPMLAERMLEKYLPVKSPQECYVVALVRKMSSLEKMVEYLQLPENSTFINASLDLQHLLLTGLRDLEKWEALFNYAKEQLGRIDSFNYWEALNSAASALGAAEDAAAFNSRFSGNNANLAKVDLAAKSQSNHLHTAILEYWETISSKPSAFDYLKPYATVDVVDSLPVKEDLGTHINLAKLKSFVGHSEALSNSQLFELYEQHKSERPKEATDYFFGTDALILAAAQTLRNEQIDAFSREKAAVILEYAVSNDPHHFYARLLLIQIYRSLGAYNLAVKHFDTLAIRNIQFETLGHLLATRAGTVDPKITARLFDKLLLARSRIPNMGTYAMASLSEGAFTQFKGIFELGKQLRFSLGHALLVLEKTKSSRVRRGPVDMSYIAQIPEPASALLDSRDFHTTFDIEASDVCSIGPKQGAEYVQIQKSKEIAYLEAMKTGGKGSPDLAFATEAESSNELTTIEKWNVKVIAEVLAGKKPSASPPLGNSKVPDWATIHWCYVVLETIKMCKDLKCSPPASWLDAVRDTYLKHTKNLNAYEAAAAEAVGSHCPFKERTEVIANIKKALAAALNAIAAETGARSS